MNPNAPLRILANAETWLGSTSYSFVRAFRRAGHSVSVVYDDTYVPAYWRHPVLKGLRRLSMPYMVEDYRRAMVEMARQLRPELLFGFKGTFVTKAAIDTIRSLGAVAINVYPDVSFTVHGPIIPAALPHYDWIFTTKSSGVATLARELHVSRASFMPHGYDPETHAPVELDDKDWSRYGCDASFIGTWSPKKEAFLKKLRAALPEIKLKIWGHQWERVRGLGEVIQGEAVFGREYAKAISASSVNIAILSEARGEATDGDLTTTRTFEIPAVGGFMMHERTVEAQHFFTEDRDCAMFGGSEELVDKIRYFLAQPAERRRIAEAGLEQSIVSGYSVDGRVATIIAKTNELLARRRIDAGISGQVA